MQTLTYGFKKPESRDKGSVFWDALADNVQSTNDHNHDGSNSSKIPATSITPVTQDILYTAWTIQANGQYRATITSPVGVNSLISTIKFKRALNPLTLPVVLISETSFYVYSNAYINSTVTAIYG